MRLYHFTCNHGARGIQETGEIRPNLHPVLSVHLAWFTPFADAKARELGLTRRRLACDRMAHRFEVDIPKPLHWSEIRNEFTEWEISTLEGAPGAKPAAWYVSREPVALSASAERSDG